LNPIERTEKALKNAYAIDSVSRQLVRIAELIGGTVSGIQDTEQGIGDIDDVYSDILLDELEHAQMLVLKLTELIVDPDQNSLETNAADSEGSVFAAGDLTSVKSIGKGGNEGGGDE